MSFIGIGLRALTVLRQMVLRVRNHLASRRDRVYFLVELGLHVCTTSLWGALDVPEHLNTEYAPDAAILSPNLAASALRTAAAAPRLRNPLG